MLIYAYKWSSLSIKLGDKNIQKKSLMPATEAQKPNLIHIELIIPYISVTYIRRYICITYM